MPAPCECPSPLACLPCPLALSLCAYLFSLPLSSRILEFAAAVDPVSVYRPPLRDVLHEWLPNLQAWRWVTEVGYLVPVLHLSAQMLYHFDQRALDAVRTFLWVHGPLMVMRGLCFSSTLLPDASQQCTTSRYMGSCHDLIFSGHVLIMALSLGVGRLFFPATPAPTRGAVGLVAALTTLLIAASRNHYTVDILLALLVTPLALHWWTTSPAAMALSITHPSAYSWVPSYGEAKGAKHASYSPTADSDSTSVDASPTQQ